MEKREYIDKNRIKEVFQRNVAGSSAYDPLFDSQQTFTEQEIIKPYLDNVKKQLDEWHSISPSRCWTYKEIIELLDKAVTE